MSEARVAALRAALDAVEDVAWTAGTARGEVALELDGETRRATDADLVPWLRARAEPAPFGDRGETRIDPAVRATDRVRARGETRVRGVPIEAIVAEIERAFATPQHLDATLLDVLVYPVGGAFARHKDTPRAADQLGTLVIALPIAHAGGAFTLTHGDGEAATIDWSGPIADPAALRWVAMYGDVDHAIAPVTDGARVTLVYTLTASARDRAARPHALVDLADAAIALVGDAEAFPDGGTLLVPCARLIVAPIDAAVPLAPTALRGADRAIADTLAACGLGVAVRECMIAAEEEGFPAELSEAVRLARRIPREVLDRGSLAMTFADTADGEYLEEAPDFGVTVACLGEFVLDRIDEDTWLPRRAGLATLVHEVMFSSSGYFGNECSNQFIYAVAVLELAIPPYAARIR